MCFLLHILIQEYNLPIILLLASNLTNICSEISKLNGFMKGFYLQWERACRSWKGEEKVNILYIVDQIHQRNTFAVDHFSKFKGI